MRGRAPSRGSRYLADEALFGPRLPIVNPAGTADATVNEDLLRG